MNSEVGNLEMRMGFCNQKMLRESAGEREMLKLSITERLYTPEWRTRSRRERIIDLGCMERVGKERGRASE